MAGTSVITTADSAGVTDRGSTSRMKAACRHNTSEANVDGCAVSETNQSTRRPSYIHDSPRTPINESRCHVHVSSPTGSVAHVKVKLSAISQRPFGSTLCPRPHQETSEPHPTAEWHLTLGPGGFVTMGGSIDLAFLAWSTRCVILGALWLPRREITESDFSHLTTGLRVPEVQTCYICIWAVALPRIQCCWISERYSDTSLTPWKTSAYLMMRVFHFSCECRVSGEALHRLRTS